MVKPEQVSEDEMVILARELASASKASWNIPARSRFTFCVRQKLWSTRNKNLMFAGPASHCEAAPLLL